MSFRGFCQSLLLLATITFVSAHGVELVDFQSPIEEQRYRQLLDELRCLQCQNQTLADSPGIAAADIRREVLRLIREGRTDAEIKTFLASRYSDFILYKPPLRPSTWILWFGPGVMVLLGAIVVITLVRRRGNADLRPDPDQEWLDRRLRDEDSSPPRT